MRDKLKNAFNEFKRNSNCLGRQSLNDDFLQGLSEDRLVECEKTLTLASKVVEYVSNLLNEQVTPCDADVLLSKVVEILSQCFKLTDKIDDLEREKLQLANENEEKTKHICELKKGSLSPSGVVSDGLNSYELSRNFMPFLQKKLSKWENSFPREGTTQDEIDAFKKYLKSSLLRDSEQEVANIREKINNPRFYAFIKDFDEIKKVVYDPQKGGRLFHKYDIYLPDLNDEARQKLLSKDETFSERVAIGGRSVRYYDDSKKFVMCNGETKYKSTDEIDVLFPGLCARCINDADILLLIPPYLYKRPAQSPTEVSAQSELKQETVVVPTSESDVLDKEPESVQNAQKQAIEADTSSELDGSAGEFAQDDLNGKINVDKKSKSDVLNNEPKSAQNVPKQAVEADTSSDSNVSPKKFERSEPKQEIESDKTSESDALNKKSESAQNAQKRTVEADTSSNPNVSPKKFERSELKQEIEPNKTSESNAS